MQMRQLFGVLGSSSIEVAAKGEEKLDIPTLRCNPSRRRLDHVVKMKLQPPMDAKGAQRLWFGPARIEDRQHMGCINHAAAGKFLQPANGDPERYRLNSAHARVSLVNFGARGLHRVVANLWT